MKEWLILLPLLSLACATAPVEELTVRYKGETSDVMTMRRVRVYPGGHAYIGKLPCTSPVRIDVPEIEGVEALAFLRHDAPFWTCGQSGASHAVPALESLETERLPEVRSKDDFVVACVIGEERPSAVQVDVVCRD